MASRSLCLVILALAVPAVSAEEKIAWVKNWEAAQRKAADAKKLIMVDFYTDW